VTQLLQGLMNVSFKDSKHLSIGYDVHGQREPVGYHDYLEVRRAWKIEPPADAVAAFQEFRESQKTDYMEPTQLRNEYSDAVERLLDSESGYLEPLDKEANEVLLLHGTKPQVVANILKKSLDPGMARVGLFGPGTYFAEHPIKSDQYTTIDPSYTTGSDLHRKLYPTSDLHPTNVRYALLCRVVLGSPEVTRHTTSCAPSHGHHSRLVNPGGTVQRFREFVVFKKESIKIEYLVAYTHSKEYCNCGIPVRRRTMYENGVERPVIACDNSHRDRNGDWVGGCSLFAKLPRCYCPNNRIGDFWSAEEVGGCYFCKMGRCRFNFDPKALAAAPDYRDSDESSIGSFIASEGEPETFTD